MSDLKTMIENAWDNRDSISPSTVSSDVKQAIIDALELLDSGAARVAEKISGEWVVHQWLKKAVLLSFRLNDMQVIPSGSIYEGAVVTMPDGRIKTGETLTGDSVRCFPLEAGDEIVRARKPDGKLKADDKSTPLKNEAWTAKKKK